VRRLHEEEPAVVDPRKKSTETTTASVSSGFSSTPMSTARVGRMAIATIAR
jgi:hypothetical protein